MKQVCLITIMVFGCSSTEDEAAHATPCERLRDHVVDLRMQEADRPDVDVAAHRAAMKQALGESFIASCNDQLSSSAISCALTATDYDGVTACRSAKTTESSR